VPVVATLELELDDELLLEEELELLELGVTEEELLVGVGVWPLQV
jgi:hypothetical protein